MELLENDHLIVIDQLARSFVSKVPALVSDLAMCPGYGFYRSLTSMRTAILAGESFLQFLEFFLCLPVVAR